MAIDMQALDGLVGVVLGGERLGALAKGLNVFGLPPGAQDAFGIGFRALVGRTRTVAGTCDRPEPGGA